LNRFINTMRILPLFLGLLAVVALSAAMHELRRLNAVLEQEAQEIATLQLKRKIVLTAGVLRGKVPAEGKVEADEPALGGDTGQSKLATSSTKSLQGPALSKQQPSTGCEEESWCAPNLAKAQHRCKSWLKQCPCTCGGGVKATRSKRKRKRRFTIASTTTVALPKLHLGAAAPETVVLTVSNEKHLVKEVQRGDRQVDVVVARCTENLSWLQGEWWPNVPRGFHVRSLYLYLKCCPYPLPGPGHGLDVLHDEHVVDAVDAALEAGVERVQVVCVMNVGTEVGAMIDVHRILTVSFDCAPCITCMDMMNTDVPVSRPHLAAVQLSCRRHSISAGNTILVMMQHVC
jgi:hypothetical protein